MTRTLGGDRRRVAVSTVSQVVGQLVSAGLAVITLRILTRTLGVAQYGVYATAFAVVTTFALIADIGVTAITGREIAKNPDRAEEIIGDNMGLRIAMCVAAWPVVVGVSFILYPHGSLLVHECVAILAATIPLNGIQWVALAYFAARVHSEVAAMIGTGQQVIMLGLSAVVAVHEHSALAFVLVYLIANAFAAAAAVTACSRFIRIRPRADWTRWRAILRMSVSLGIIQIINLLYLRADSLVISTILGSAAVGVYTVAYSLLQPALSVPTFFMAALMPSMTRADPAALSAMVRRAYRYVATAAMLMAAGGYAVRVDAVTTVSSSEFLGAATPFAILAGAAIFSYLNNVMGYAATAIDKQHRFVRVSIAAFVLNVALNLALVPAFGLNGAASATVATEVISFCGIVYVFRADTGIRFDLVRPVIEPVVAALVTVAVVIVLPLRETVDNALLRLILDIVEVVVLYSVAFAALVAAPRLVRRGHDDGERDLPARRESLSG